MGKDSVSTSYPRGPNLQINAVRTGLFALVWAIDRLVKIWAIVVGPDGRLLQTTGLSRRPDLINFWGTVNCKVDRRCKERRTLLEYGWQCCVAHYCSGQQLRRSTLPMRWKAISFSSAFSYLTWWRFSWSVDWASRTERMAFMRFCGIWPTKGSTFQKQTHSMTWNKFHISLPPFPLTS
jgi:hypothetical protein